MSAYNLRRLSHDVLYLVAQPRVVIDRPFMCVKIIRVETDELEAELDILLYRVLWAPLDLPADIRRQFSLPGPALQLAAVADEQMAGAVVFHRLEEGQAELRHVAVEPRYQASGVGRQLVQEGLRMLSGEGCRVVSTIVRNTSSAFFEKLGFVRVSEQVPDHPLFLRHGIRFQKMIWRSLGK